MASLRDARNKKHSLGSKAELVKARGKVCRRWRKKTWPTCLCANARRKWSTQFRKSLATLSCTPKWLIKFLTFTPRFKTRKIELIISMSWSMNSEVWACGRSNAWSKARKLRWCLVSKKTISMSGWSKKSCLNWGIELITSQLMKASSAKPFRTPFFPTSLQSKTKSESRLSRWVRLWVFLSSRVSLTRTWTMRWQVTTLVLCSNSHQWLSSTLPNLQIEISQGAQKTFSSTWMRL